MRLKNLDYSDMNQEQKKIHDDIASLDFNSFLFTIKDLFFAWFFFKKFMRVPFFGSGDF